MIIGNFVCEINAVQGKFHQEIDRQHLIKPEHAEKQTGSGKKCGQPDDPRQAPKPEFILGSSPAHE